MTNLKPIRATHVSDHVYEALEAAIIQGELAPGATLSDRALADALGVSRTPVREALQRLESPVLVQRRGNVGWTVASTSQQDVRELFELRRVLEPLGLKHLSKTWDKPTVHELSGFFEDFPAKLSPDDLLTDFFQRDHNFHQRIVECSQNTWIIHFYSVVEKQIDRIRHYIASRYDGDRFTEIAKEHRQICAAIAESDVSAATAALLHHLYQGEEATINTMKEQQLGQWGEEGSSLTGSDVRIGHRPIEESSERYAK